MKEKIHVLKRFQSKSTIVSPSLHNLDVFSYTEDDRQAYVNYLKVSYGSVIQAHTIEIKKKVEETKEDLLSFAITEIRQRMFSSARQIIVPFKLPFEIKGCRTIVPRKGDKQKLLKLSERNVTHYRIQKSRKKVAQSVPSSSVRVLNKLAQDLRLKELPVRIECFDVSNIQGKHAVASCVVFHNARPLKKEYRHYQIQTVAGADDYASIGEVVMRRYRRLLNEQQALPQLIVIDGGKGQLHAALKSLESLGITGNTAIIGIAKRLEEIYFPGDPVPLYLKKNTESLKILQHVRNEAHRFGINLHRNKRSKEQVKSVLDDIKGIGPQTIQKLMIEFRSVEGIRKAARSQLEKCIGPSRAQTIYQFLHGKPRKG
jgi:excinuclease ABC subunit C